jgi:hypothetical protein
LTKIELQRLLLMGRVDKCLVVEQEFEVAASEQLLISLLAADAAGQLLDAAGQPLTTLHAMAVAPRRRVQL